MIQECRCRQTGSLQTQFHSHLPHMVTFPAVSSKQWRGPLLTRRPCQSPVQEGRVEAPSPRLLNSNFASITWWVSSTGWVRISRGGGGGNLELLAERGCRGEAQGSQ